MTRFSDDFRNTVLGDLEHNYGVPVTYRRGTESVDLTATVGESVVEVADESGFLVREELRDYLIDAADLVLSGVQVEPRKGDRIEETIDGALHVHEVRAPAQEPVFRHSDRARTRLRVHTKLIDEE